jgi:hypothetical protein
MANERPFTYVTNFISRFLERIQQIQRLHHI